MKVNGRRLKEFWRSTSHCFIDGEWVIVEHDRGVLFTPDHYLGDEEDIPQVTYSDMSGEEAARDWFIRISSDKNFLGRWWKNAE